MSLQTILCSAVVLPMIFAGGALASSGGDLAGPERGIAAASSWQPDFLRPQSRPKPAPVRVAQQGTGVGNLEEQLRNLNGKIEELNFQVLQMQDQIRKMQEDNEFRFQQLEGNPSGTGKEAPASGKRSSNVPADMPARGEAEAGPAQQHASASAGGDGPVLGAPPITFGTITFDASGNVVGGTAASGILPGGEQGDGGGSDVSDRGSVVAALPPADNADQLYRDSYQFILSGEYKTAEAGFRRHITEFPNDPHAADAHFWLGEALLGEDRYRDAAEVFLKANRKYPNARKAPDMLLKLGIALAAMNQRDVACATYGEIGQRYPDVSAALQKRIRQERSLAGC